MRSRGTNFKSDPPPFQGGRGGVKRFDLENLTSIKSKEVHQYLINSQTISFSPTARLALAPWYLHLSLKQIDSLANFVKN